MASAKETEKPLEVILFGEYAWNKRLSDGSGRLGRMSFEERSEHSGGGQWWCADDVDDELEQAGERVRRARDWGKVVELLKATLAPVPPTWESNSRWYDTCSG
jgi:hypothetical protein